VTVEQLVSAVELYKIPKWLKSMNLVVVVVHKKERQIELFLALLNSNQYYFVRLFTYTTFAEFNQFFISVANIIISITSIELAVKV
jgi:heptaprenylglyceryl phosphate synthase